MTDALFFGAFMAHGPVPRRPRDGDPDRGGIYRALDRLGLGRQRRPRARRRPALLVSDAAFIAVLAGFALFMAVLIAIGVSMWRQAHGAPLPRAIEKAPLGARLS